MPWKETCAMEQRMSFVIEHEREDLSIAELCRRHEVSRKTGYKWLERFVAEGLDGLKERSRAPHHHPAGVAPEIEAAVLAVRERHPSWGPRKVKAWLLAHRPEPAWPAASTIGTILARHGLVRSRRRRRLVPPASGPLAVAGAANALWSVDFKGWFRTGDGARCDPLTLQDVHTRYALRIQAVPRPDGRHVWPLFEAAFREYGLPEAMRSDNGPPFASAALGGLSRLAVKLIKAGVIPQRIAPGKPQQNGRHERLHLTLKQDTAQPPAASVRAQQRRFDAFRRTYNEERPHEALGQTPPAAHYHPSPRPYRGRPRAPEYPADHHVRRVRGNGEIKWRGELIFLSETLTGEPVGIEEVDDGFHLVRFGPVELAVIDPRGRLHRPARARGTACGFDGHRSRDAHNSTGPTAATTKPET